MTRTLTAGMQTAVAGETASIVHFVELASSGGTTRLCTAPQDVEWDSQTWSGFGGHLAVGAVEETPDGSGNGVELTLSGVDQTIISVLMNNQVRGYTVQLWRAHINSSGAVVSDPLDFGTYYQLQEYRITETRPKEGRGTCTVKTRVVPPHMARRGPRPVRCSYSSHNDMLARAGATTGDTFFQNLAGVVNREIFWGQDAPSKYPPWSRHWTPPDKR